MPGAALSETAAIATLTQTILGSGVLALPYAFKSAGVAGGALLTLLIYVLSAYTMTILVLLVEACGEYTYRGLAENTLKRSASYVISLWVLCYTIGITMSYPVILGDFVNTLTTAWFGGAGVSREAGMTVLIVCVCWPLSCTPSLGFLSWTSLIGFIGVLLALVAVIVRYADGTYSSGNSDVVIFNADNFGECFPVLVAAFGAHFSIPSLFQEVIGSSRSSLSLGPSLVAGSGTSKRSVMLRVIAASLTISGLVYGAVGILVYATFGQETKPDFSMNFHSNDSWLVVVRITMMLAICATFPLVTITSRETFMKLVLEPLGFQPGLKLRIASATILCTLCLLTGLVASNVAIVLAYNGSIFGTPVCFVAPSAMYLWLPAAQQRRSCCWCCRVCCVVGLLFAVLGVVTVAGWV